MTDVAVVVPAFNAAATITDALRSILTQHGSVSTQVIVVDDGSTDGTAECVRRLDPGIHVIAQANAGAVAAANAGFRASRASAVVKLDADDVLEPAALAQLWHALQADEGAAFSYSDYLEEGGGDVHIVPTKDALPSTIAGGVMIRRHLFAAEGFYRAGLGFPEYDLLLRTQSRWRGVHVAAPLYRYRRNPRSLTRQNGFRDRSIQQLLALHPEAGEFIAAIREY